MPTNGIMELLAVPVHGHILLAGEGPGVSMIDTPAQELTAWVVCKPIAEALGLNWDGLRKALLKHPTWGPTTGLKPVIAADGKLREMDCMPLEFARMWVCGIHPNKVAEPLRPGLIVFQLNMARLVTEALVARRHGLPLAGSKPLQGNLFEVAPPQAWLEHPEVRRAVMIRLEAFDQKAAATTKARPKLAESVAIGRRFGLSAGQLDSLALWLSIGRMPAPMMVQPQLALEG